jgi:ABC transporter substrate binding protein
MIENRFPSMYTYREDVLAGGLISYATNYYDVFRRAAILTDKILKGAKPADLLIQQPTKFELVINLKTAKALGLEVPPMLLTRADEVIESYKSSNLRRSFAAVHESGCGPQLPRWRTVGAAALCGKVAARSVRWRGRK